MRRPNELPRAVRPLTSGPLSPAGEGEKPRPRVKPCAFFEPCPRSGSPSGRWRPHGWSSPRRPADLPFVVGPSPPPGTIVSGGDIHAFPGIRAGPDGDRPVLAPAG